MYKITKDSKYLEISYKQIENVDESIKKKSDFLDYPMISTIINSYNDQSI